MTEYVLGTFDVVRNIETLSALIRITYVFKAIFHQADEVMRTACCLRLSNTQKEYQLWLTENIAAPVSNSTSSSHPNRLSTLRSHSRVALMGLVPRTDEGFRAHQLCLTGTG